MEKAENRKLKVWQSISIVLGFTIFLFAVFLLSFEYFERNSEREVSFPPPNFFRVFVLSPDKSEVINFEDVDSFKKDNQNFSFIIPGEKLDDINEMLKNAGLSAGRKSIPKITIEQSSGDKQIIKISHGGDGIYSFRYEATDKSFKPLTMNVQGPGFIFGPCCATGLIGFIGLYLLRFVLWYLKRQSKKAEKIGE